MRAAPMPDGLSEDIDNGEVNPRDDFKKNLPYIYLTFKEKKNNFKHMSPFNYPKTNF